jgi:hypothetical protein
MLEIGKIQIRIKNLLELLYASYMDVYSNPLEAHKII